MSSRPLLSTSLVEQDYVDTNLVDLQNRVTRLEAQLDLVKRDAVVIVLNLLGKSLKHVASGELDLDDVSTSVASSAAPSKWDAIKKRLPPSLAEAVSVLALHGSMNNSQLAAALGMARKSCSSNIVPKLKAMGLIVKNGNNFELKEL
jgi:hypothetical protein